MDGSVLKIIKVKVKTNLMIIDATEGLLNFSEKDAEYRIVRQKKATATLKKELDDIEEKGIKELIGYRDTTSKYTRSLFSFFYKMLANKEIKKLEKRIKEARKKVSEIEEKIKAEECP